MRTLCLLLALATQSHALTKTQAVQLTKSRVEALTNQLGALAESCYQFEEDCDIQSNSQGVALKWIPFELGDHPPKIEYSSGRDKFLIDGALRIAKTGYSWGSPVILNEDLLFHEKSPGHFEALDFFDLLGVLVHEFGHHQETKLREVGLTPLKHEELDEMGAKVVNYLKDRTRRTEISNDEVPGLSDDHKVHIYQIDIEWFNGVRNIWSHIFVDSIAETKEISRGLMKGVTCPKEYSSGHLRFSGEAYYAAFRKVRAPQFTNNSDAVILEQDIGEASVFCVDRLMNRYNVFDGYKDGHLTMTFKKNSEGQLVFDPANSHFRATAPPDWHGRIN